MAVPKDLRECLKPATLRKAERSVVGYKIVIEPNRSFGFVGSAIEFPTVLGRGKTREECLEDTEQALIVAAATMIHLGERPPKPTPTQARTEQINIRVTRTEKSLMKKTAERLGFRSIGDFVRNTVMECVKSAIKLP